ncbi:recombinase family protein [Candidatus Soleaferrea massiliensis]|uniref:recombinase family protein n=1 Tax=Candidatus Soleaferrea massiliensis TaxID=1470354 RepID=UPI0009E5FC89|nr:recombinase family protein [Candidatus Soleaferrea massiliensis]
MEDLQVRLINDPRKFAVYTRKSKFTGKGESIDNQFETCKEYIKYHYPDTKDEDILEFLDEGYSGGNTNRPHFRELMNSIKKNEIKAVVVYRLDRISRNVADFAKMYQEFALMNVAFISTSERYDTSTSMGRAMLNIATVFAQLERETTAERIRDNMHELAKTGRWLGGTTPTGYKSQEVTYDKGDGKTRKLHKLATVPEEAELVRMIFRLFLEMDSLTKVETYLLQHHITTKNDKDYTRFSIKNILQNPVYMRADADAWDYFEELGIELYAEQADFNGKNGVIAYNKTNQKASKAHEIRDVEEWIIAVGKHHGLISGADWIKTQQLLANNASKSYRKPRSNVALLSGLLFCGKCGGFMRPKLTSRKNAAGERIYTYMCETKEKSRRKNCDMKTINGNTLDKAIIEEIKKLSANSSDFIQGLERTKLEIQTHGQEIDRQLEGLRKTLGDNQKEITSLVNVMARSEGTAAYDHILNQINELDAKSKKAEQRIEELVSLSKKDAYSDEEFDMLRQMLQSFGDTVDNMSVEQKRAALRVFIERVEWDGQDMHVYLFGSREVEVDLSGVKGDKDEEPSDTADSSDSMWVEGGEPLRGG